MMRLRAGMGTLQPGGKAVSPLVAIPDVRWRLRSLIKRGSRRRIGGCLKPLYGRSTRSRWLLDRDLIVDLLHASDRSRNVAGGGARGAVGHKSSQQHDRVVCFNV